MNSKRLKSPVKRRRRYLWKKYFSYSLSLTGIVLISYLFLMVTMQLLLYFAPRSNNEYFPAMALMTFIAIMTVVASIGFVASRQLIRAAKDQAEQYYAAPVHEQIAALPAEEILVRSSDQPAASPGELLRAAQEGTGTASKELLRAESRAE